MTFSFVVNCEWSSYGEWSECSATCGGGSRVARRRITQHALNGGRECIGDKIRNETCSSEPCSGNDILEPVNCLWSRFGEWTACTKTCGGGERKSTRTMVQLALYGGKECKGNETKLESCNENPCPGRIKEQGNVRNIRTIN